MPDLKKLPTLCPSCAHALHITQLCCENCQTKVSGEFPLPALLRLSPEQQQLALDFIKSSGSLKTMSQQMQLSYPTVRNMIDDLIEKLNQNA